MSVHPLLIDIQAITRRSICPARRGEMQASEGVMSVSLYNL